MASIASYVYDVTQW